MKQHTIILVPHARAKFRKWRFSSLQAGLLLGSLAFLTVGGLAATILYLDTSFDRDQLVQVQTENNDLRQVNQRFEVSIQDLETKVADYQQRIHKLAIVAGVAELSPGTEAGIGGTEPLLGGTDATSLEVGFFGDNLRGMDDDLRLLEQRLDEHQLKISAMPAVSPTKGLMTSKFGYRTDPFTGRKAFHRGIDIVAPAGKEVIATGDGLVVKAGRTVGLGNAVYISHGFGLATRYGHLSRLAVEVGDQVSRGDVIGFVGSSGRSTGTHLHYEVHRDGKSTNPLAYVLDGTSP